MIKTVDSIAIRQIARDIERFGADHAIVLGILRHATPRSYAPTVRELAEHAQLPPEDAYDICLDLVRAHRANWAIIRTDRLDSAVRAA